MIRKGDFNFREWGFLNLGFLGAWPCVEWPTVYLRENRQRNRGLEVPYQILFARRYHNLLPSSSQVYHQYFRR